MLGGASRANAPPRRAPTPILGDDQGRCRVRVSRTACGRRSMTSNTPATGHSFRRTDAAPPRTTRPLGDIPAALRRESGDRLRGTCKYVVGEPVSVIARIWPGGVTELPASMSSAGRPHRPPLRPVVAGAPFGGDLDPSRGVTVQPPTRGSAVEGLQEVPAGNRTRIRRIPARQSRIRPEGRAAKAPTDRWCGHGSPAPYPRAPAPKPDRDAPRPDTTSAGHPSNARPAWPAPPTWPPRQPGRPRTVRC